MKTTDLRVFCCNIFNHQDQLSTNRHGQPLRASAQNPTRGASLISQLLGFGPTKRQRSFDTTFQGTFTQSAVRGHGACCTKVQIGCFNSDLPAFGFKVWQSHTFTKWFATTLKSKVANCSWPAVTLVCLYRNGRHLTVMAHAAVTAVSDGGSSNRWTKMWVKGNLQGPSATRPWLHGFAHSGNIGSRKSVWCGIPQNLRNMNVSKKKE